MVQHKLWVHRTPSAQSKSAAVLIVAPMRCVASLSVLGTHASASKKKSAKDDGADNLQKRCNCNFSLPKSTKKDSLRRKFRKRASLLRSIPLRRAAAHRRRHPAAPGRSRQHRRTPGFPAAAGPAQRACCASCQRHPFSVFAIAGNSQNLSSAKKKKKRERATRARTHEGLKLPLLLLFFSFLRPFPPATPPVFLTPPASAHPVPCTPASRHIPESDLNRACGQRVCVVCVR